MSLYLDSAIVKEAIAAVETGWVHGITTNPALLAKSEYSPADTFRKLSELDVKEIFYQVSSSDPQSMDRELKAAEKILKDKLVLKIPPTKPGFQFAARTARKYKTCITAVFNPSQALVAREIGVDLIAIYVNRATRLMGDGIALTKTIAGILEGRRTEILAASLKTKEEVIQAFTAGAQHLTLPFDILSSLIDDPHSKQAVEQFDQFQAHL